jgi:predicted component of type VI protein secretion system
MGHAKQPQTTPQTTQTDTLALREEEKKNAEVINMRPGQPKMKQSVMKDTQRVFNSHKNKSKTRLRTLADCLREFAGRMSRNWKYSECHMIIILSP